MKDASAPKPSVLVVMTEQEKIEFLPPDLEARLRKLFPDPTWVQAPLQESEWQELLAKQQPEILLCAWETPPLPPEVTEYLKYVCFLCGSVRISLRLTLSRHFSMRADRHRWPCRRRICY